MDPLVNSPLPASELAAKWFGDLVDLAEAEAFRTDDPGVGEEVWELFRAEIFQALHGLEVALDVRDTMQVRKHAHSLQGMGGAVGAPEISLVGLVLSDAAKASDRLRMQALVEALGGWMAEWVAPVAGAAGSRRGLEKLKGTVLVVDDEEASRSYLKELLTRCGAFVMIAQNGEEALEQVQHRQPDVALVDVNMSGMDGYEVCRAFKSQPGLSRTAVIMVTVRNRVEDVETGFELGAFDYIRKPFHSRELLARVRNALDLKRRMDELRTWNEHVTREMRMAGALQASLFNPVPVMEGLLEVRTAYSPSQHIGGDCFDVSTDERGVLRGYVADVAGHGVASALVSTLLKGLFAEAFSLPGPLALHEVANRVHARFRELIDDPELYATVFLFRLDPFTPHFEGLNAGHPFPLVFSRQGHPLPDLLPDVGGMPLGMWPVEGGVPFEAEDVMQVQIPEGAGLFLFTDGLTEARDGQGEEVGREGLEMACARIAGGDPAAVLAALRARGFGLGEDDCTLMAVQLLAKDSVVQTGEFEPAAEEAEGWASRVQSELEMAGWTEDAAAMAGLVAMEHIMNLQDHADVPAGERCMLRMSVDVDRGICVLLFRDPGRKWIPVPVKSVPLPASLADTRERGRGWQLIQSICSRTTYFRREGWNHHRFEISKAALGLDAADRPEAGGAD